MPQRRPIDPCISDANKQTTTQKQREQVKPFNNTVLVDHTAVVLINGNDNSRGSNTGNSSYSSSDSGGNNDSRNLHWEVVEVKIVIIKAVLIHNIRNRNSSRHGEGEILIIVQ